MFSPPFLSSFLIYSGGRGSLAKNYEETFKMADNGDWCLIESDPGVFTELIRGFGRLRIKHIHFQNISAFCPEKKVYALFFKSDY